MPTFRDGGIWEGTDIASVATHQAWLESPKRVIEFFDQRRCELASVEPNAAHHYFANLPDAVHLTQNVDDLCERAGQSPIHLHGKLTEVRCDRCRRVWDIGYSKQPRRCPFCHSNSVRPNVVLFGENAPNYRYLYTIEAEVFLVVGTSAEVLDVADIAQNYNVSILIDPVLRKRKTMFGEFDEYIADYFTYYIQAPATKALSYLDEIFEEIL